MSTLLDFAARRLVFLEARNLRIRLSDFGIRTNKSQREPHEKSLMYERTQRASSIVTETRKVDAHAQTY